MRWRLRWRGTPCTPPPRKGGEQRCHQMNRSSLAGGYPGRLIEDGGFRTEIEFAGEQMTWKEGEYRCILFYAFLQTKHTLHILHIRKK